MTTPLFDRLPILPSLSTPARLVTKLPLLLSRPVRLIPFIVQRAIVAKAMQPICQEAIDDGDFDFLQGRCLQVRINDINLQWSFGFEQNRITLIRHQHPDVTISGNLKEFLLLAGRQEDPDTLFFQRRLMIEGDTDLGHGVKNILDAIELEQLPLLLREGLEQVSARL